MRLVVASADRSETLADDDDKATKKHKKRSEKVLKSEETTTDSDQPTKSDSPKHLSPRSPVSYSPAETTGYPTHSLSVPYAGMKSTDHAPALSPVQQQWQTDPHSPLLSNSSLEQQLRSLSQMVTDKRCSISLNMRSLLQARDGDEVLITLHVNALNAKPPTTQHACVHSLDFSVNARKNLSQSSVASLESIHIRTDAFVIHGYITEPRDRGERSEANYATLPCESMPSFDTMQVLPKCRPRYHHHLLLQ